MYVYNNYFVICITSATLGHCCCYHINFYISLICLEMNSSISCVFQPSYLEFDHFRLTCLPRAEKAGSKIWNLVVQTCLEQEGNYLISVFSLVVIILTEDILPEVTQGN